MGLQHLEVHLRTKSKGSVAEVAEEVVRVVRRLVDDESESGRSRFALVWEHTDGFEVRFHGDQSSMTPARLVETYYQEKERKKK